MCIYYGQALDGFGWPYQGNADVILYHGTNEIARHRIVEALAPGINFMLTAHLHDGTVSNAYFPDAVRPGDVVNIIVQDAYGQKPIMESHAIPVVGGPGDMIHIRATAGTDRDGDSMADDFELAMLAFSTNPYISTIEDILPGDDFDGDGVSNMDEYRSGNFAFLEYDYFVAERFAKTANDRLRIEFLSVAGKAYSISATTNLNGGAWMSCPHAGHEEGALSTGLLAGTGAWIGFYVPVTNALPILRLEVK